MALLALVIQTLGGNGVGDLGLLLGRLHGSGGIDYLVDHLNAPGRFLANANQTVFGQSFLIESANRQLRPSGVRHRRGILGRWWRFAAGLTVVGASNASARASEVWDTRVVESAAGSRHAGGRPREASSGPIRWARSVGSIRWHDPWVRPMKATGWVDDWVDWWGATGRRWLG